VHRAGIRCSEPTTEQLDDPADDPCASVGHRLPQISIGPFRKLVLGRGQKMERVGSNC
jgi:hypothetical protein